MKSSYRSTNETIELRIIGYDEPNNGRELHVAQLWIDGKNLTSNYFKGDWNRLNWNLTNFMFESPNQNYVFVPAESTSFVINTKTLRSYELPILGLSTINFLGNRFIDNVLILEYRDQEIKIDLSIDFV